MSADDGVVAGRHLAKLSENGGVEWKAARARLGVAHAVRRRLDITRPANSAATRKYALRPRRDIIYRSRGGAGVGVGGQARIRGGVFGKR